MAKHNMGIHTTMNSRYEQFVIVMFKENSNAELIIIEVTLSLFHHFSLKVWQALTDVK